MPIARGRWCDETSDRVHRSVGCGCGRRGTARFDDRRSALLHGADEFTLEPIGVGDDIDHRTTLNFRIGKIRVLGRRVVAPDAKVADLRLMHARLLRELALRAVFIKTGHRKETILWHTVRVVHGDQCVGVAGISYNQHAHIAGRIAGDGLTLTRENLAVDAEQIATLHSRLAWHGADQQGPVGAIESLIKIRSSHHFVEQRKGAVIQFHHHALQRSHAGFDLDEPQIHRLVRTKNKTGCDAKKKRVADLASSAGD